MDYTTPAWRSLRPIINRAQLLLVIEGVKRGARITLNYGEAETILAENGLDCLRDTTRWISASPHYGLLVHYEAIAKPKVLDEYIERANQQEERQADGFYHRLNGWLLGYPACCIEEYIKPAVSKEKSVSGQRLVRFAKELKDVISATGSYPEELNYRPPSFTPCSIACEQASPLLKSWQEALERLDPEAATALKDFNRKEYPE